jgi:hypothetical protein
MLLQVASQLSLNHLRLFYNANHKNRSQHTEFRRYGGPTMVPPEAHRRFRAKWSGGPGTYFPYASALTPARSHLFRDEVNFRRHHYRFMDELWDGLYGDPVQLLRWAESHNLPIDVLMDLAEIDTQIPVEGPRGQAHRGARENVVSLFEENDLYPLGVPSRI